MKPKSSLNLQLGKFGEDLATRYLQKQGYSIIERNFKARYGELDIIAVVKDILVFVEVKTRIGSAFGKPEEAVTPWKLKEVIKTAEYYVLLHPELSKSIRIDVIGIELDTDYKQKYFNHIISVTS